MAERVLRGSRLGAVSYENERGQEPAARYRVEYDCPNAHRFSRTFAAEAELPASWECPSCGSSAIMVDGTAPESRPGKPVRTHWDMLLERRSKAELESLLAERLAELRGRTGARHSTSKKSA